MTTKQFGFWFLALSERYKMYEGDLFYSPLMLKANGKHEEGNLNFIPSVWVIRGLWLLQIAERMPSLIANLYLGHLLQSRLQHLVGIPVPGLRFNPPVPSAVTLSTFILPDTASRCLTEPLYAL